MEHEMSFIQPVKDEAVLNLIPNLLTKHYTQQFCDIWIFGINTALRVTDILNIRFVDIEQDRLRIRERKTKKSAEILLNSKCKDIIERIRKERPNAVYLFESNQNKGHPLSRQTVGRVLKDIGEIVGLRLSTHSMRKTRGYHLYKKCGKIEPVTKMLRHSSTGVTLRYIGIEQEDIDKSYLDMEL